MHLGRLQLELEPVQQLHHLGVQLKVREVVVHPQQQDSCHLAPQLVDGQRTRVGLLIQTLDVAIYVEILQEEVSLIWILSFLFPDLVP